MKVKPLNDWVVIIPDEAEGRTAGGIYIPDSAKDKPVEGVVEAVGPGAYEEEKRGKKESGRKERKFIPTSVKPGDHVLYEKYAGQSITLGSQERILVREKNVLGYLPSRPRAADADPAPARFPLVEIKTGERTLMKRGATAVALAHQHEAGALKPAAGKAAAKTGRKAVKKAAKKAVKKAGKKTAGKKTAGKAAGKPAAGAKKKTAAKKAKKKR
jgi:chaperonin GroES